MVKEEIGPGVGVLALISVLAIMVTLLAVLALVVVQALARSPWGVFTIATTIPVAFLMGAGLRSGKVNVTAISIFGLAGLAFAVWGGQFLPQFPAVEAWFRHDQKWLAWAILRERPSNRSLAAIPVALLGVILISGVLEQGAYGRNPGLGVAFGILTAVSYAGFLLLLRQSNRDLRRPAGPLFDATLVAGLTCIPIGLVIGNLDWTPGWPAQGYLLLLALSSQVLGWLLISITLPRLPAALTSVLLTFQPVLTVLFAWAILDESPSALQLGGVALVLCGLLIVSTGRRRKVGELVPAS
jgi:uncharacterized membrane protein